jgi:thiamine biosynthesis lipoprotein
MVKKFQLIAAIAIMSSLSCSVGERSFQHVLQGRTMGTSFTVKIVVSDKNAAEWQIIDAEINALLVNINQQMSTYLADSEISSFNKYDGTDWFDVSEQFARVVQMATMISRASDGAFDATIGPLVNLWGFGPENRPVRIPSEDEITNRMQALGYEFLEVRENPPALRKKNIEIYCDLSAIAKGFGVDVVAGYLERQQFSRFMVEIGGEVKTRGLNSRGEKWKIGVASPDSPDINKVLHLHNTAVATSGDYFNYFEEDGIRYSHTIDPRTGRPIGHKLASVTVLHESCMLADGYATAINVLGPDDGYEFALKMNLPIFMIVREGSDFIEKMTPSFETVLN